ncbi:MAG: hydrogenase maturation protease [Candidatus Zixiibacteriota bacterium]
MGNELFGDDAVGLLAVRKTAELVPDRADFVETGLHGVALLDLLIGYEKAIIVDAVKTGRHPPGTIVEIEPDKLVPVDNPSPHFTGVPELIRLAGELKVDFPNEIRIIGMEVANTGDMGKDLTGAVATAIDQLTKRVISYLP